MKNLLFTILTLAAFGVDFSLGLLSVGTLGMALVRFGGGVSEIRGSIGGTTYSRNKSGAIARNRTKPVNTQSSFRDEVKAIFGSIAQAWRGLSEEQRTNWISMAPSYQAVNALGEDFNYSGQQLFQKLNSSLQLAGRPGINDVGPPIDVELNTVTGGVADTNLGTFVISLSAAIPATAVIVVEATPLVSPGKKNVQNMFKQIGVITNADSTTFAATAGLESRYGIDIDDMTAGQVFYIRTTVVMLANGQRGVPFQEQIEVITST